jgi:cell division protease FtsH
MRLKRSRPRASALELIGPEQMSPQERRRAAYHESGRALVGMLTTAADPVQEVSIVQLCPSAGITFSDRVIYERGELEAKLRVALGGRFAEELMFGQSPTRAESDLQPTEIARRLAGRLDVEVRRIVETSHAAVFALLRANRWRLDALAEALLKYETLDESMAYAAAGLPDPGSAPGSFKTAAFSATRPAA